MFLSLVPCRSRVISRLSLRSHLREGMAMARSSLSHEERTAAEPRENTLEPVVLSHVQAVNDSVRLLKLHALDSSHTINFLPGQWLDTFIPGLRQAGGFTITSTPSEAKPMSNSSPYLELAVQKSGNPPAQWLWQPPETIIRTQLMVRVGGSFTWPPPNLNIQNVERLVLIAGGVGINPLISIFSHLIRSSSRPREVHFLYSTKTVPDLDPQRLLFLPRLRDLVATASDPKVTLTLFLTNVENEEALKRGQFPTRTFAGRIKETDLIDALDGYTTSLHGPKQNRQHTLCYVCGPQKMTDEIVAFLGNQEGMDKDRVLCEKWW